MLLLDNENYCNVICNTKISIFSVDDGVFPLSQYCSKPYGNKIWTDEGIILKNRLSSKRCVNENLFRLLINRFKKFDHMVTLTPDIASVLLMTTIALHNLLSLKSRNNYTLKSSVDPVQTNGS